MTWVKLDDGFTDHPKIDALSAGAFRLHVSGLCYSAKNLTDGIIPANRVSRLTPSFKPAYLGELDKAGVWEPHPEGWMIHDFLEYQPSKDLVLADRGKATRRRALHADPVLVGAVRARDGDRCRYCGRKVAWRDRRGPLGATYDHVDADGPNSLENVVVACRACNSAKRDRTLEALGWTLLEPGSESGRELGRSQVQNSSRPSHPSRPVHNPPTPHDSRPLPPEFQRDESARPDREDQLTQLRRLRK